VAARIGIELEHYTLRSQLEEASAIRERARLARDLHDGLLQSLTAAGLQLKAAVSRADGNSQKLLENLRELLAAEQRRVRLFITTRPAKSSYLLPDVTLASVMSLLRSKLELLWGCAITVAWIPDDAKIPRRLAPQIDFILAEAIANAVHHGRSSRVDITAKTLANHVVLQIRDNGTGFDGDTRAPDPSELTTLTRGPVSLQNRIAELNGTLSLTSSPTGTTLDIRLPLSAALS
jgi:signal transduction histidine kinase